MRDEWGPGQLHYPTAGHSVTRSRGSPGADATRSPAAAENV
jgi:hypothetical protein